MSTENEDNEEIILYYREKVCDLEKEIEKLRSQIYEQQEMSKMQTGSGYNRVSGQEFNDRWNSKYL